MRPDRKQRPVQVGAVGVEPSRALGTVFAVVAVTHDDLAQRLQVLAEVGTPAVVLEADYLGCLAGFGSLDAHKHVPDQTLFVGFPRLRVEVEDTDTRELLAFRRLVGVAH
jgi:hypothetical protein